MVGYNSNGPARDRVLRLMEEKDRMESEIRDQTSVLESNNVGIHDPLVDDQGFPRNDIDVYKVRHARHRIICLQNDHKSIMKRIEQGLAEVHSEFIPSQGTSNSSLLHNNAHHHGVVNGHRSSGDNINGHRSSGDDIMSIGSNDQGFATITFVHDGSPADLAGLCEGDEVLQFGSVSRHNFSDVTQVHNVVSHSVGQNIRVAVRRNNHILHLTMTPRPWAQPGLLGCQIVRRANE